MKRMRQICDRWTEEDVQYLSHFGIKAKVGYMYFNIEEDTRYYEIRKHFENRWQSCYWSHDCFFYEYSLDDINLVYGNENENKSRRTILPKIKRGNVDITLWDQAKLSLDLEWADEKKTSVSETKHLFSLYINDKIFTEKKR